MDDWKPHNKAQRSQSTCLVLQNGSPLFIRLLLSSKQRIIKWWDRNLREKVSLRTRVQFVLSFLLGLKHSGVAWLYTLNGGRTAPRGETRFCPEFLCTTASVNKHLPMQLRANEVPSSGISTDRSHTRTVWSREAAARGALAAPGSAPKRPGRASASWEGRWGPRVPWVSGARV